jgi:hypothetical protein
MDHQQLLSLLSHVQVEHRTQGLELLRSFGMEGLNAFVADRRAHGVFALLAADPPADLLTALPQALEASGQSPASLLRDCSLRCRWSIRHLIHCRVFLTPEQTAAGETDPAYPPQGYGYMLFFNEGWVYSRALAAEDDLVAILDQPQWLHLDNEPKLPPDHPHLIGAPQAPAPPEAVDFMSRETDGDMTPDALYDAKHQAVGGYDDLDGYEEDVYFHAAGPADQLSIEFEEGDRWLEAPRNSPFWDHCLKLFTLS